jgi:molecular chaperone DnaK
LNYSITKLPNYQMTSDRIVGIDLGTTNSLVAFMQGESPVVIPGDDGSNLVPSVVALDEKNQPVIGNAARASLISTGWKMSGRN